jgi:hypothetical protein
MAPMPRRRCTVSVADAPEVVEGNDAPTQSVFLVTLSKRSRAEVRVRYRTVDGSAVAGSDYVAKSGTLTFKPGVKQRKVKVNIINDAIHEEYQSFELEIFNPRRASLGVAVADGYIADDDDFPIGALVITEIMADPSGADPANEYVEIYNPTASTQDLTGLQLADSSGPECNMIGLLEPGDRIVYSGAGVAGGINCTDLTLLNAGDTISVIKTFDPTYVVDQATYTAATEATSRSLDPDSHDAVSNDSTASWCDTPSGNLYNGVDLGTPGAANPQCP